MVPGQLCRNEGHRVVWVMEAESELVVEAVAVRALRMTAIAMGKMV